MDKKELILKQIDATLKQEEMYLEEFNKQLKDPNTTGPAREKVVMFREACLESIDRCKKAKLQYI